MKNGQCLKQMIPTIDKCLQFSLPWLKNIMGDLGDWGPEKNVVCYWRFDNLCWSHLQSQVRVLVENSKTLVRDLIEFTLIYGISAVPLC